jgi:uncharacterized protein (TIGR03382 family)
VHTSRALASVATSRPVTQARPRFAFLLGVALAAQAHAQETSANLPGSMTVELLSIGDRAPDPLSLSYMNLADCRGGAVLAFAIEGLPSTIPFVDIYAGDAACNQPINRGRDSVAGACVLLLTAAVNAEDRPTISIGADRFDCDRGADFRPKLWFLGVHASGSDEDVAAHYAAFDNLTIKLVPPQAPSKLRAAVRDRSVRVSWTSEQPGLSGFVVFLEPNVTEGGDAGDDPCGSTALAEGAAPDALPSRLRRINVDAATGLALIERSAFGSSRAAVAVAAMDEAGNLSPLSNVACVDPSSRVALTKAGPDANKSSGCSCFAVGSPATAPWPVLLLAWSLRRRTALSACRRR